MDGVRFSSIFLPVSCLCHLIEPSIGFSLVGLPSQISILMFSNNAFCLVSVTGMVFLGTCVRFSNSEPLFFLV